MDEGSRPVTDLEAIAEWARTGSERAFASIVSDNMQMVYGVCLRILKDVQEAEDATQAVFLYLVRKGKRLREGVVLSGWLYRTAEFVSRDADRRRRRRRRHESEATPMSEAAGTVASEASFSDLRPILDGALAAIPAKQRDAIVMRFLQGRTNEEIARETGAGASTVSSRLSLGLEKLRGRLARRGVAVSAAALAAFLAQESASAAPPALLASIRAACAPGAAVSIGAHAILKGAVTTMLWKSVSAAAAVLLVGGFGLGVPMLARAARSPQAASPVAAPPAAEPAPAAEDPFAPIGDGLFARLRLDKEAYEVGASPCVTLEIENRSKEPAVVYHGVHSDMPAIRFEAEGIPFERILVPIPRIAREVAPGARDSLSLPPGGRGGIPVHHA